MKRLVSPEDGDEEMYLAEQLYYEERADNDVDDLIVDGTSEVDDLDAGMEDIKILEENKTKEQDHWKLGEDMVSILDNQRLVLFQLNGTLIHYRATRRVFQLLLTVFIH